MAPSAPQLLFEKISVNFMHQACEHVLEFFKTTPSSSKSCGLLNDEEFKTEINLAFKTNIPSEALHENFVESPSVVDLLGALSDGDPSPVVRSAK